MSRRTRLALVVVAVIAIIALCWFALLNPIRGDIAATDASIEAEQAKLAVAQATLAQAETTRQEGRKNQARLLELAKMVPESEEVPSLLLQIQDLADQSGIEFISITPGDPIEAADFRILPLSLEFLGTYFDLSDFVYRAEQMVAGPGRLLAVKTIRLQLDPDVAAGAVSGASVSPPLAVDMTLYAFESGPSASATPDMGPAGTEPAAPSEASPEATTPVTNASGS